MWLIIIIYGTVIAFLVWVLQRKNWRGLVRLPIAIVIGIFLAISLYYSIFSEPTYLGGNVWYNRTPFIEIIFFLLMIFGMAVRYITKAIEDLRDKKAKLKKEEGKEEEIKKIKLEFNMWEFSYPFFFSIIIFGSLLKLIEVDRINLSNLILSFQTGFFWQTILKKEISN